MGVAVHHVRCVGGPQRVGGGAVVHLAPLIGCQAALRGAAGIAHLARLELKPEARSELLDQLNGFFGIVERMSAVDTSGIEPLYTPLSAVQAVQLRLREDAVTEADDREANQRSAPAVQDGLFLVPKVIE